MKRTILVALAVAAWGLVSMGIMGGLLYYAAAPVLWSTYGDLNDWHGDDVWPATIGVGMLWSLSFLVAGWLNARLQRAGWSVWPRRAVYVLVLWLGAVVLWLLFLATMDIGFAGSRR